MCSRLAPRDDGPHAEREDYTPVTFDPVALPSYSTVTLLARLRGLSTSQPRSKAM